jgi:hypothetical protein
LKFWFRRDQKLKLYSNDVGNEFAIKINGEDEFKVVSNQSVKYDKVIDDMKVGSGGIFDLPWDQILRRWISWKNNISEKDYKFLKSFEFLPFINENEKVIIVAQQSHASGGTHDPPRDKIIVTNERIIILIAAQRPFHLNWVTNSVLFDEIRSIELSKGLFPLFSYDIIVKSSQSIPMIKITSIKKSIAEDIVNYVNDQLITK